MLPGGRGAAPSRHERDVALLQGGARPPGVATAGNGWPPATPRRVTRPPETLLETISWRLSMASASASGAVASKTCPAASPTSLDGGPWKAMRPASSRAISRQPAPRVGDDVGGQQNRAIPPQPAHQPAGSGCAPPGRGRRWARRPPARRARGPAPGPPPAGAPSPPRASSPCGGRRRFASGGFERQRTSGRSGRRRVAGDRDRARELRGRAWGDPRPLDAYGSGR